MPALDEAAAWGGRLAARALSLTGAPPLSVLIFHRVLPAADPLFPGELDAARFDRLMAMVARTFNVLTLGSAARRLHEGTLPERALAITFDDGYADNASLALPILKRHGLVASFFVATGFLDGGRMWNDSVIETVRRTRRDALDLGAFGLGELPLSDARSRRAAIDRLLPVIKYSALRERLNAVDGLHEAAGRPALPDDLMMTCGQVAELHRAGMEIGGHTENHPILAALPEPEAEREIRAGRERLQQIIGSPVTVFAYPNGRPGRDFDPRHVEMVRRLGFTAAVTTAAGVARHGDDLFQLPRYTPWDRTAARWLGRLVARRRQREFARVAASPSV